MFNEKTKSVVSLCNLLELFVSSIDFTSEETTTGVWWTWCHFVPLLIIIDRSSSLLSLLRCTTLTRSQSEGRGDQLLRFDSARD